MAETLITHQATIRFTLFMSALGLLAALELWLAARPLREPRWRHWGRNLSLLMVDTVILRLVFPALAIGPALWAQDKGIGLFHQLDGPPVVEGVAALIVLDFVLYAQHWALHRYPWLWRLHRTHHLDVDLDVTSGVRFHPAEIVLSMALKIAVIVALGISPVVVVIFEALLNLSSLFTHSNIRLAPGVDRVLRGLIITPAVHRMHHSTLPSEHNRNFGFFLSAWDRLLGTFLRPSPQGPLELGLGYGPGSNRLGIKSLLVDPVLPDRPPGT
jgi:sterol desaturase/sphingolipid hydroxylase (fatty acid hydroxylase superfamily)